MTDTSVVTVLAVDGGVVDLRVRTTTAGGLDDYSTTRSFALTVLADARRRATDLGTPAPDEPTALQREQEKWPEDWYVSGEFMQKSVGDYIAKTECLARRNVFGNDRNGSVFSGVQALSDVMRLSEQEQEALWLEASHSLDLRVHMTDARWLEGIFAGLIIPTTAFDPWFDDPLRPEPADGALAPPSIERWRVYSMEEKYWAVRLHGTSFDVRYGKLGTAGQTKTKDLGSADAALKEVRKLIREKTGKGYEYVNEGDEDEGDLDREP